MAEIVCGLFPSRGQAEGAFEALVDAGFYRENLGLALTVYRPDADRYANTAERNLYTLLPNLRIVVLPQTGDTLLGGTIETCLEGLSHPMSLSAALQCLGIGSQRAEWYADKVQQGYAIVTLLTDEPSKAQGVMMRFGSLQDSSTSSAGVDVNQAPIVEPQRPAMSQIQHGFGVFTRDGLVVGTVQEAADNCLHIVAVQHIFLPPERIQEVDPGRVVLNVTADEINNLDWAVCQPEEFADWEPGGPGYSGLVPQEHEGGTNVPTDPAN